MNDPVLGRPPGKVQAIGILHLVGGILNLGLALFWLVEGFLGGVMSFGIGCVLCVPFFLILPTAILEIISGAKHLSANHAGLTAPRLVGVLEICSIIGCGVTSLTFGILTIVFLNDPEVEDYYRRCSEAKLPAV